MRKSGRILLALLLPCALWAQTSILVPGRTDQGAFMGGLGMAVIDDTTFITMNLRPELAIGKFGIGLDIPLRYNMSSGEMRGQDWNDAYDYFRVIRYARYGRKRDKFYTRVGALDAARIGHGFIMNYYANQMINYDERKLGLALDVDAGYFGFESMTSNLGRAEIFAGRAFFRPIYGSGVPILRNFAIGASYVSDIDPDGNRSTDDGVSVYGFDVELPLVKTGMVQFLLYSDWAKINKWGSGSAVGAELSLRGLMDLFSFTVQLERRFLQGEFLPAYFNSFYELERYRIDDNGVAIPKESLLAGIPKSNGTFGLLYGQVLNTLEILGTYERLDGVPNSGIMHIEAKVPNTVPKITMHASYNRINIDTFSDAIRFDDNSIARAGIGYKIYPFLVLYMDYIWTYRYDEVQDRYRIQRRIEPQIAFVYPFAIVK